MQLRYLTTAASKPLKNYKNFVQHHIPDQFFLKSSSYPELVLRKTTFKFPVEEQLANCKTIRSERLSSWHATGKRSRNKYRPGHISELPQALFTLNMQSICTKNLDRITHIINLQNRFLDFTGDLHICRIKKFKMFYNSNSYPAQVASYLVLKVFSCYQ